jgi:hypothetical protein
VANAREKAAKRPLVRPQSESRRGFAGAQRLLETLLTATGFAVVSRFISVKRGTHMKNRKAWIVAALLTLSGGAFAQGSGNGGGSAGGGGNGAGMSSSDQTGAGMAASGTHAKAHQHKKSSHKKPATDTTNMPGADASSDTKGQ